MKHKSKSIIDRLSRWLLSLMGLSLAMVPAGSTAAEEQSAEEPEEAPVLSPEEFFEGGANTYNSWVELSGGGYFPSGNRKQFQQGQRTESDAMGGIEDFHYKRDLGRDVQIQMDGRAIFDNHDYKLSLDVEKPDLGYVKFDYEQFRTWYNGDGGNYAPVDGAWYPWGDDALALDRAKVAFEAGLTLENLPDVTFRYTHRIRDGEKSSTSWGSAFPAGFDPFGTSVERKLMPAFYDIDETVDIFELDVSHRIKATDLGVGARYETGDLNNAFHASATDPFGVAEPITDREGTTYDFLNVHAYTETWIKKNLFLTTGFMFADLDNDFSGNRTDASSPLSSLSYTDLNGGSRLNEYTFNVNLMAQPWTHFSIVPSVRVQKEDWDADSTGLTGAGEAFDATSDGDALDVRERLELRYTGMTNWVLYARGEWTQGDGTLNENGGMEITAQPLVLRETEDSRFFQKYVVGANWYPLRKVSLNAQYYYQDKDYDYDHLVDSTPDGIGSIPPGGGFYPAALITQGFQTHDANVRLTVRPHSRVSSVTRYDIQYNTIDTEPNLPAGAGTTETARTTRHVLAESLSWTPWSRLFLQLGFNYVWSETVTPVSDYTSAILDAQNNYWTLNLSSAFVLTDKTDLYAGYFFYKADNYEQSSLLADGGIAVPYGAGATQHGITCGLTHRLRENIRLNLRYGFAKYEDETSGGNLDYDSHMVYGSVQYRF